jgi:hypothetical protein
MHHFVNRNGIKLIYYALVYPYLIYRNLIWGNTYRTRIQKIMNIQKKIVRLMKFKSYMEHTEPIFKELNILDIFKINDYLTNFERNDSDITFIKRRFDATACIIFKL